MCGWIPRVRDERDPHIKRWLENRGHLVDNEVAVFDNLRAQNILPCPPRIAAVGRKERVATVSTFPRRPKSFVPCFHESDVGHERGRE